MPVIQISLSRIRARARNKVSEKEILDALPYIGLDIEDQNEDLVSVEYSPNRPDFCSEAGIARSLVGLLEIEKGLPRYDFRESKIEISVEGEEIKKVRPYAYALYSSLNVTEEVIRQLIVMQEDLHNGIGRHRSKAAIGIHNAEMVRPPIKYFATEDKSYSFVPLNSSESKSISQILEETNQGREYGSIVSGSGYYPLLIDSSGNTLSMPPIINGELTRLKQGVKAIFVDVTTTDKRTGETAIAIIASMLSDMGGRVESVTIKSSEEGSSFVSPDMSPSTMKFDLDLTNKILGLKLTHDEARDALHKSRLELRSNDQARVPRFRSDIIHPIDLVEEVELGYGVSKLSPAHTRSRSTGSLTLRTKRLRAIAEILIGLELTEIESLSLSNRDELGGESSELDFKVENPKSKSYEFLRSEVLPSLVRVLSRSTHEEYPQRIFEQISVFKPSHQTETGVAEEAHIACAIAGSGANYTMIRSILDGLFRLSLSLDCKVSYESSRTVGPIFAKGRTAVITLACSNQNKIDIGLVGEVSPAALENLGLQVPAAVFEINLEPLLNK